MKSYYFVKYNSETSISHFKDLFNKDIVFCFDLEDSIEIKDKNKYREYFKKIILQAQSVNNIKIGVRINKTECEFNRDISEIKGINLETLIIPKSESYSEINHINESINKFGIKINEIIPLIETRKGFENLSSIIENSNRRVKNIGFGHCDYNKEINNFPFFHQNSFEYWKWVKQISKTLKQYDIGFINSSVLEIDNDKLFTENLQYLTFIGGVKCSQFTLTKHQTNLTSNFNNKKKEKVFFPPHRYKLSPDYNLIEKLINEYEKNKNDKSFSIKYESKSRTIISPQEYFMAKKVKSDYKYKTYNFVFVGGCFPIQHDILFEDLFHQRLKRKLLNENIKINVDSIRYERLSTVIQKVSDFNKNTIIDILVFHIRPEPFLRISNFFYKYLSNKDKVCYSFNIPFLKILNPEKYDAILTNRKILFLSYKGQKSKLKRLFVDFNYFLGRLLRNNLHAQKLYLKTTLNVFEFCQKNRIHPIILGPIHRFESKFEPILCMKLNNYMLKKLSLKNNIYIDSINSEVYNIDEFINKNGKHSTNEYHDFVSDKLKDVIISKLKQIEL